MTATLRRSVVLAPMTQSATTCGTNDQGQLQHQDNGVTIGEIVTTSSLCSGNDHNTKKQRNVSRKHAEHKKRLIELVTCVMLIFKESMKCNNSNFIIFYVLK